jgi:hypothetical protein
MLTENDIIENLTNFLIEKDYEIVQSLTTNQQGIDVIAKTNFETLYIEAKGETSSKQSSNRFGKPFNGNQIKSHISVALLATMKVISNNPSGNMTKVGIALPDTIGQRKIINQILPALKMLDIRIYWVTKKYVKIE